jgi:RNA-binding protein
VELTGKQRRQLRGLGHHLEPVVLIGHQGITPGVIEAVDQALEDHELIKVKFNEGGPQERREGALQLAAQTQSQVAQVLGRMVLLFRQRDEKPKIKLVP